LICRLFEDSDKLGVNRERIFRAGEDKSENSITTTLMMTRPLRGVYLKNELFLTLFFIRLFLLIVVRQCHPILYQKATVAAPGVSGVHIFSKNVSNTQQENAGADMCRISVSA
jgi:hypothetical protein